MEKELTSTKKDVRTIFDALRRLIQQEPKPRKEIGYKRKGK